MWVHVIPHFEKFLAELQLSANERLDAENKAERIAKSLCKKYYPGEFNPNTYTIVGSHGKHTPISPHSDLDMLFLLPVDVYTRIDRLIGNGQSALLQEFRRTLLETFPNTTLRADGQVVMANFQSYSIEIVPAFIRTAGGYLTAHTENGGSWKLSNPAAEFELVQQSNAVSLGKATHLLQMLKAWKQECNVELKCLSLEVLACEFVKQWQFRDQSLYYYDWMVRDFFNYLLPYANGRTRVMGTEEWNELGDCWLTKAQSAHARALKACDFERQDYQYLAAAEWQKIFGDRFEPNHQFNAIPMPLLARA